MISADEPVKSPTEGFRIMLKLISLFLSSLIVVFSVDEFFTGSIIGEIFCGVSAINPLNSRKAISSNCLPLR